MDWSSDKKLLWGLTRRDEQAYEALLDRYEAGLYRFFYYSHRNHQTAQDQCGETFFRFIRCFSKNDTGRIHNLRAYLFGIARNIQIEWYRKMSPVYESVLTEQAACERPSVFSQVSSQDELDYVQGVIEQFDDPERQVLLLRFMESAGYEEISEIMKIPLNSVKSHIHRGRKKLRKLLSKNDSSALEVEK